MTAPATRVVVVTGLSGAGKSTALHAIEDLGYYCVDNLPPVLVSETVNVCVSGGLYRVALGMDVRVGAFLDSALGAIETIEHVTRDVTVLFLDANEEALLRRFSETRRPHPALLRVESQGKPKVSAVLDGVRIERERLKTIRDRATLVVDTTRLSVHELRRQVIDIVGSSATQADRIGPIRMQTRLVSFGFKYGVPLDADLVFDVRFLDNPHFVEQLRALPGTDPAILDFVLGSAGCKEFLSHFEDLLMFLLPRYEEEGKSYLTVAIGCTGGKHRSVAVAAEIAVRLSAKTDGSFGVLHRDIAQPTEIRGEPG